MDINKIYENMLVEKDIQKNLKNVLIIAKNIKDLDKKYLENYHNIKKDLYKKKKN